MAVPRARHPHFESRPKRMNSENSPPSPGGISEIIPIVLPMIVSQACETIMIFTDRLFLSRLGPEYMSAAMAGGLSSFMVMTFFIGLIGYVTALAAQYLGSGQKDCCAVVLSQAVVIVLAATPVVLAVRPLVHDLFGVMNLPSNQLPLQRTYFDILVLGTPMVLIRTGLAGFFSGIGRTRIVMLSSLTAMTVNVIANYCLIFGHLGFPKMGLRGAAYGTLLGSFCGLFILLIGYFSKSNRSEFSVSRSLRFDREVIGKLIRYGTPSGLEMFLNLLAFNLIILIFHSHSVITATAITIVFNWDMVSFVPLLGIQVGVVSLVGRYMGNGRPDIAQRVAKSALKIAWSYSGVILLLFVFLPEHLVKVFEPFKPDLVYLQAEPLATSMLRLAAIYVLADAMVVVFSGVLRGAGDTLWAMGLSVTLHWLLVPVVIVCLKLLSLPPLAAWMTLVGFFLSFCGLFYLRYRSGQWKSLRIVETPSEFS